jgi:hypothetical protein
MQDPRVLHGRLDQYFHLEVECAINLKVEDFRSVVIYSARRPLPLLRSNPKKRISQNDRD